VTVDRRATDRLYRERNLLLALASKLALQNGHPGLTSSAYRTVDESDEPGWQTRIVVEVELYAAETRRLCWEVPDADAELFGFLPLRAAVDPSPDVQRTPERIRRLCHGDEYL
jgi:hypothetical protein